MIVLHARSAGAALEMLDEAVFFFQAEDGIRDIGVTGVQTCALPILAAASSLVLSPAFAEEAPPALAAYERETGGRIGVYAENLASGAKIAWRADERFVMCSTFKASLAAFVLARVDRGEDRLEAMVGYGSK